MPGRRHRAAASSRGRRAGMVALLAIAAAAAAAFAAPPPPGPGDRGYGVVGRQVSFDLTDHRGRRVSEKDFAGSLLVVYFGFVNCPDVCPVGLARIAQSVRALGADGERVGALFISVDDKRDTPAVLAEYVSRFDERMVGLGGDKHRVFRAARSFGMSHAVLERDGAVQVSHLDYTYIVSAEGVILDVFDTDLDGPRLTARLRERLVATVR